MRISDCSSDVCSSDLFEVDGVIHYCVANMPGAVARTSAFALNNATLPFALKLANLGAEAAIAADPHLANGLNVSGGKIRHGAVAEALNRKSTRLNSSH